MLKKTLKAFLVTLVLYAHGFLFSMEKQSEERQSEHDYSLSASFDAESIGQLFEQEARRVAEQLLSEQELSDTMLTYKFHLPIVMIFVEHGADLNYTLKKILARSQKANDGIQDTFQRTWVLFCLIRGAKIPDEYQELVLKIVGKRVDEVLTTLTNKDDSSVLRQDLQELFLLATGRGYVNIAEAILTEHGDIIPNTLRKEGFINAAYAGHEQILRIFYRHNENDMLDELWSKTLSYALQSAALRQNSEAINLIIKHKQQCQHNFSLNDTVNHLKSIMESRKLPEHILDNYRNILNILYQANTHSGEDSIELVPRTVIPCQRDEITRARKKGAKTTRSITILRGIFSRGSKNHEKEKN